MVTTYLRDSDSCTFLRITAGKAKFVSRGLVIILTSWENFVIDCPGMVVIVDFKGEEQVVKQDSVAKYPLETDSLAVRHLF